MRRELLEVMLKHLGEIGPGILPISSLEGKTIRLSLEWHQRTQDIKKKIDTIAVKRSEDSG